MIDAGFPLDEKKGCQTRTGNITVEVTPLFWALTADQSVSDSIIEQLIQRGGKLSILLSKCQI